MAYNNEEFVRRKFRVMNLLAEMFDDCDWHILHSPFIYSAGTTKSIVVCDVSSAVTVRWTLCEYLCLVSVCDQLVELMCRHRMHRYRNI